jgi:hypothetical protein
MPIWFYKHASSNKYGPLMKSKKSIPLISPQNATNAMRSKRLLIPPQNATSAMRSMTQKTCKTKNKTHVNQRL